MIKTEAGVQGLPCQQTPSQGKPCAPVSLKDLQNAPSVQATWGLSLGFPGLRRKRLHQGYSLHFCEKSVIT